LTANDRLAAEAVRHSAYLVQYENGVIRRIIALLNRSDARLAGELQSALERLTPESFTVQRLEKLLKSVREVNADAYKTLTGELEKQVREFADYEAGYQSALFERALPAQVVSEIGITAVNVEQAYAAALARPFQGRLLSEWAQSIESDRMVKIRDTIRMGFVANKTTDQIIRDIRGTAANKYADGVLEISRRHAAAVTQTALAHTAATVKDRFYEQNARLIKSIQWVSTLDSRTTPECRLRDGKQYDKDHKPIGHSIPWGAGPGKLHWNCRSTSIPVLKSVTELGGKRDIEWSKSTRASMDGQVADDLTYAEWLKRQPADVQDDVLGKTRAKLYRDGKISFDRFYNDKGKFLTLDELRQRDSRAFSGM